MRAPALLAGLLLIPAAACAQIETPTSISYAGLNSLAGITFCVGSQPVSFIRSGMDSVARMDTEAHEAMHRQQYGRYGCKRFDSLYINSPKVMLESEAEAYAAGWCVGVAHGADSVETARQYIQNLYRKLGGGTMVSEVLAAWQRYAHCPTQATWRGRVRAALDSADTAFARDHGAGTRDARR